MKTLFLSSPLATFALLPNFFGRARTVKKEQVGGDAGVGRKDAVGQADNAMQVEV